MTETGRELHRLGDLMKRLDHDLSRMADELHEQNELTRKELGIDVLDNNNCEPSGQGT